MCIIPTYKSHQTQIKLPAHILYPTLQICRSSLLGPEDIRLSSVFEDAEAHHQALTQDSRVPS